MTDQEKEMAASAYEAFLVNQLHAVFTHCNILWAISAVITVKC